MSVIDIKPDAQGKVRDLYDLGDKHGHGIRSCKAPW